MIAWIKSIKGIATGIAIVVIILVAYAKCDAIKGAWYNSHILSANAHGDTAKVAKAGADSIAKASVSDSVNNEALAATTEVRSSPIAQKVVKSSNKVIANKSAENVKLRAANTQLGKQVEDTKAAGEKPGPRWVPYLDIMDSFKGIDSTSVKGRLLVRIGVDYRLPWHINAKVELEKGKQYPLTLNVGAHITFR